ncbi:MAG: restriction endonuclease, SacI family [Candidatus Aminicenantes bacterium]|nr:restriction endonuclease, SacI family [Candidatus Aminicenantes bacterium]
MQGVENFIQYCRECLDTHWQKIIKIASKGNIDDALGDEYSDLKSNITDCLKSTTKSYHYVLPTQLLCKVVEHSLDCRSLQASYGKPGAFDARSIAHRIIVPFDKKNHNVLGGSLEPYVNNPLRQPSVTIEYESKQKNKGDWLKLVRILETVEERDDPDFTEKLFNQVLIEIFRMLSHVSVTYPTPSRISLTGTLHLIRAFTSQGSGGDRMEAVVTALFQEIGDRLALFDEIKREKVNVADRSSGMAGDIECYANGKIVLLVEVKDKSLSLTQLESKIDTARARGIRELLFFAEKIEDENQAGEIYEKIKNEFNSGQNVYLIDLMDFASSILVLLGEEGRVSFLRRIGLELDRSNSLILHKKTWAKLLRET